MNLVRALLAALGLRPRQADGPLSAAAYTREFAPALQAQIKGYRVVIKAELEIALIDSEGKEITTYLNNSYKDYCTAPEDKEAVIHRYIAAFVDATCGSGKISVNRITPVIKDRAWPEETKAGMVAGGQSQIANLVYEPLNEEIVIVYAEDSPRNLRYLSNKDLEETGLQLAELRPLAIRNLKALLSPAEIHGGNGLYMISAGGDYEASLILFDDLWDGTRMTVDGDYVIAIPARDLLLVTGSNNTAGIAKLAEIASETVAQASYALTADLFIRTDGVFAKFRP